MPFGKTLTIRQSAAYLDLSTKTVRRYLKRGLLKYKIEPGKHGDEIWIYQSSLDKILGQLGSVSKEKQDIIEMGNLFRKSPPDVKDVVMKILRSHDDSEKTKGVGGLFGTLFRRKNGEGR